MAIGVISRAQRYKKACKNEQKELKICIFLIKYRIKTSPISIKKTSLETVGLISMKLNKKQVKTIIIVRTRRKLYGPLLSAERLSESEFLGETMLCKISRNKPNAHKRAMLASALHVLLMWLQ